MEKETQEIVPACAACDLEVMEKICMNSEGKPSKGCPTLTRTALLEEANREYENKDIHEFARQANIQEAEGYANRHQRPYVRQPAKTRIEEICEFSEKMGYKKLGIAFCIGLSREAEIVEKILRTRGFEVVSALCKAGRTSKDFLGIDDKDKIRQGTDECMCNPIFQAKLLNQEKTDFNILLGLCVGHDSLFFKYADAFTTVLASKDRVLGHNPLAAIYQYDSFYEKLKQPKIPE